MGTYVEVKIGTFTANGNRCCLATWELEPMLQALNDSCGGKPLSLERSQVIRDLIETLHIAARDGGQVVVGID